MTEIGLISDTHGLIRNQARDLLRGVDLIIHAGDIGGPEILSALEELAPVRAVRGNCDRGVWARDLLGTEVVEVGGVQLYVIHSRNKMVINPAVSGFEMVVFGHSHQPGICREDGVYYINPGSAGPRRFRCPVSLALLRLDKTGGEVTHYSLISKNRKLETRSLQFD